ncbi:copper chaperone [Microvirga sp. HBU67558]|uniref:heavy-metal-associated domain-containing protein n=1 Tax=Microvirga TaxID=186650 RepID=UPI001B39051F|nr:MULTISPECIES: cation transporter [unclassified Microvirga]MBQ0821899.1 copper chaperone [Microvirga sp. HBU67558]
MHLLHVFHVPALNCGGCLGFVVRALQDIDQQVRVEANLLDRTVRIISSRFESALLRALRQAGFPAEPVLLPWG